MGKPAEPSAVPVVSLEQLRELAGAATPGPWTYHEEHGFPYVLGTEDEVLGVPATIVDSAELSRENARFIAAASPSAVLGLLDQLAERDRYHAQLKAIADLCIDELGMRVSAVVYEGGPARAVARLIEQRAHLARDVASLHRYIDEAKVAAGINRVSGEPLAEFIRRVLQELADQVELNKALARGDA